MRPVADQLGVLLDHSMKSFIAAAAVSALCLGSALAKCNPIVIKGNAFFDSKTNERFYIRGVDYQPGGSSSSRDPLADDNCKNDIPLFKELGINAIRVYQVDNAADHSKCMKALDEAGIYLILDATTSSQAISRADAKNSYNAILLQHLFATMDVFSQYDNVLAFFAGNEVINDIPTVKTAPWIKATVRDMRKYSKEKLKRYIPVGYSAADVAENRIPLAFYLNCGSDEERTDFYAFNSYSWCGMSSFTTSGYDMRVKEFSNYTVPLFYSEFGCNKFNDAKVRPFTEIEAIYSDKMTAVYSGGLVYEWTQEVNNYGLVDWTSEKITKRPDYENLKKEYAKKANPTGDGNYKPKGGANDCPPKSENFDLKDPVPPMPKAAEKYFKNGAGTPLGSGGPSNIDMGPEAALSGSEKPTKYNNKNTGSGTADKSEGTGSKDSTGKKSAATAVQMNIVAPIALSILSVPFLI